MTGATPAWVGRSLRLDPNALPARWSVPTEPGTATAHDASVYLDRAGVILKRRLSGLPLTLSLPLEAYRGVAIRVTPEASGALVASVELLHADPALTLPLAVTRDMEAAAEDWQRWSDELSMPMLLIEPDGTANPVERSAGVPIRAPQPRRRTGLLTKRRPRFLVRRKPGHKGYMPVLKGWREIISYE
jgi:hypothetical protein